MWVTRLGGVKDISNSSIDPPRESQEPLEEDSEIRANTNLKTSLARVALLLLVSFGADLASG
jgi:hypothetical protein